MSRRRAALPLWAAAALACGGGESKGYAIAEMIESLSQAPGGPKAMARVGDILLRNDQITAVVEQGGLSAGPLAVGGSLIDLDLVRHEEEFRSGHGLDQLGQIGPVANLQLANATGTANVRITQTAAGAEVTAAADSVPVVPVALALTLLINQKYADRANINIYTEYEVRPGERLVRMTTTAGFDTEFCPVTEADGCNPECDDALYDDDCDCPQIPARCRADARVQTADALPDGPGRGLLDLMLGDLPRPLGSGQCETEAECDTAAGESCVDVTSNLGGELRVCRGPDQRDAGVVFGDMLIYSKNVSVFVQGPGFDSDTDIRRLFDAGEDTLARPLILDGVFTAGDRVSYGYAAPNSSTLIPIFGGPFSMGATAGASCPAGQEGCLSRRLVRFERWLSVGDGDVSSAQEPIYRAAGDPLGVVTGNITWAHSAEPISGARVFALADPRDLPCDGECQSRCDLGAVSDGEIATWSLDELIAANRCRTVDDVFLTGTAAIESFAESDVGVDPIADGRYRMALKPGRYVLVAIVGETSRSTLAPVTIAADRALGASFSLAEPGRVAYTIMDESGKPAPGRVIIGSCLPDQACTADDECDADQRCSAGRCLCEAPPPLPLELGGSLIADGVIELDQTAGGRGVVELAPGSYEMAFARGPHYSQDRVRFEVESNVTTSVQGTIRRVVDRKGWVTSDFHVHSINSLDSDQPVMDRVVSFLADDLDHLFSSDHDWITRYSPIVELLGLSDVLGTTIGIEVTTQNLGHFIGFPLAYAEWKDGERLPGNNAINWRELSPDQIFAEIRQRTTSDVPVVISIPHPYGYFDAYRVDPVSLEPIDSVLSFLDPLVAPELFSGDFDVMELMNTDNYDLIRRPTISEVRFFSTGRDALLGQLRAGEIDQETYDRQLYSLSMEATKRILQRTRPEQDAALAGNGGELLCTCGSDGDCSPGYECDFETMSCVLAPAPAGQEPPAENLCRSFRGVVDDWFNMLNRGVRRTGLSGSDVHDAVAGRLRTLLRTGATTAPNLKDDDIAEAVLNGRAVVTSGPMIHFQLDQAEIGDTVTVSAGDKVQLSIRVENPRWYDVDRVEVYRNGELIHWATGCDSDRADGVDEPHDHPCVSKGSIVSWDETIEDTPDRDAWYVVIAMGLDGGPLSPVYESIARPRLGTTEIILRIYNLIPELREFGTPRPPTLYPIFPYAITNPIWVDVGGNGWDALSEPPSWCRPGDIGC